MRIFIFLMLVYYFPVDAFAQNDPLSALPDVSRIERAPTEKHEKPVKPLNPLVQVLQDKEKKKGMVKSGFWRNEKEIQRLKEDDAKREAKKQIAEDPQDMDQKDSVSKEEVIKDLGKTIEAELEVEEIPVEGEETKRQKNKGVQEKTPSQKKITSLEDARKIIPKATKPDRLWNVD